jgi:hypothetical protein
MSRKPQPGQAGYDWSSNTARAETEAMNTKISIFQPIGDAATELREVVPGLDHAGALDVLQHTETVGGEWVHDHHVTFKACEGWTVTQ